MWFPCRLGYMLTNSMSAYLLPKNKPSNAQITNRSYPNRQKSTFHPNPLFLPILVAVMSHLRSPAAPFSDTFFYTGNDCPVLYIPPTYVQILLGFSTRLRQRPCLRSSNGFCWEGVRHRRRTVVWTAAVG